MLGDAMRAFGDLGGVVFNRRTGHVVGGHQRLKHVPADAPVTILQRWDAPTANGTVAWGFIDWDGERWGYREVDVDEQTEVAMNIAANKHGGSWEMAGLAALLSDLDAHGYDMALTGFSDNELREMLGEWESTLGDRTRAAEPEGPSNMAQLVVHVPREHEPEVRAALERIVKAVPGARLS